MDNQKDMQVFIVVKKNIFNKVIMENRTNFISYPYCINLNIRKCNPASKKYSKRLKVVNFYDN